MAGKGGRFRRLKGKVILSSLPWIRVYSQRSSLRRTLKSLPRIRILSTEFLPKKVNYRSLRRLSKSREGGLNAVQKRTLLKRGVLITGTSFQDHLESGKMVANLVCDILDIKPTVVDGRVKKVSSHWAKLNRLQEVPTSRISRFLAGKEIIGLRIIVKSDRELQMLSNMIQSLRVTGRMSMKKWMGGKIFVKDYVKNPRQDGRILGKDEKDMYRAVHIYTEGLTGAPMDIQLLTEEMQANADRLKEKYGKAYWKDPYFRETKRSLGDYR